MDITEQDAELLETIAQKLSDNILKAQGEEAITKFENSLGIWEMAKIGKAKLAYEFNKKAAPYKRAKTLTAYCGASLPALKRTFSEEFLITAMPDEAKSQHAVELCEELGQTELADLCRKAMKATP